MQISNEKSTRNPKHLTKRRKYFSRPRWFRPSIELKEKNMSEMFQFLHLALHFLASMPPLTMFKWQNVNMYIQAQQLNFK